MAKSTPRKSAARRSNASAQKNQLTTELAECQAMIRSAGVGIMRIGPDLTIRQINPKAVDILSSIERHLPCAPAELVGMPVEVVLGRDVLPSANLASERHRLPLQIDVRRGQHILGIVLAELIAADGDSMGLLLSFEDVTDRRRRQQELDGKLVAIGKTQAVIEFDMDGTVLGANDLFLDAMGYTISEVRGKHHRMFVQPDERESDEYREFWAGLNRGEFTTGEFKRVGKNGKEVWIQGSYTPIRDALGQPTRVIKYATDVTAQKMAAADAQGQLDAIRKSQSRD